MSDIDLGQITEALNDKMDRDGNNAECPTLLSRTPNSQGGVVEIWSDGYCVQTGYLGDTTFSTKTIDLLQPYIDMNFIVTSSVKDISGAKGMRTKIISNSQISFNRIDTVDITGWYRAEGYIR